MSDSENEGSVSGESSRAETSPARSPILQAEHVDSELVSVIQTPLTQASIPANNNNSIDDTLMPREDGDVSETEVPL